MSGEHPGGHQEPGDGNLGSCDQVKQWSHQGRRVKANIIDRISLQRCISNNSNIIGIRQSLTFSYQRKQNRRNINHKTFKKMRINSQISWYFIKFKSRFNEKRKINTSNGTDTFIDKVKWILCFLPSVNNVTCVRI